MGRARTALVAGLILASAAFAVMASTGPSPDLEVSSVVRRHGGACLRLDRWGLVGWRAVGITQTIADAREANWIDEPQTLDCQDAPLQTYLIRLPIGGPDGIYRVCGLADSEACVEFRRVPFDPGEPGP